MSVSAGEMRLLMEVQHENCVSIYLPTHRCGKEVKQDSIRLKNLLRKAEDLLLQLGVRPPNAKQILEPAARLLADSNFWRYQEDGLALFLTPDNFYSFRLPISFDPRVEVFPHFEIRPLIPLLSEGGHFYILGLSQGQTRLWQATRQSMVELKLQGLPLSLEEALQYDNPEKQLQFHTGAPQPGRQRRPAMFHGQASAADDAVKKKNLLRFFQLIDSAIRPILGNRHEPLLLAGVDYLIPIYREANSYPHLMSDSISGNPEQVTADTLHQKAWSIMEPHFLQVREQWAERYQERVGTDQVSDDVKVVVSAACKGQVDCLFVDISWQQWGVVDAKEVRIHKQFVPGDIELLNESARQTLLNGGTVFAVANELLPGNGSVAALLRNGQATERRTQGA